MEKILNDNNNNNYNNSNNKNNCISQNCYHVTIVASWIARIKLHAYTHTHTHMSSVAMRKIVTRVICIEILKRFRDARRKSCTVKNSEANLHENVSLNLTNSSSSFFRKQFWRVLKGSRNFLCPRANGKLNYAARALALALVSGTCWARRPSKRTNFPPGLNKDIRIFFIAGETVYASTKKATSGGGRLRSKNTPRSRKRLEQ